MTQSFPFKSAPFTILERSNRRDLAKKVEGVYFENAHKDQRSVKNWVQFKENKVLSNLE